MATPGFLKDGIDFEQLMYHYINNNCYLVIADPTEVELVEKLMKHVIGTSFGYSDDFSSTIHGRFQMIFNSTLEETPMEKAGLTKRSTAIWSLNGSYESGTDFRSDNDKQIEAKVYIGWDRMLEFAKKGSIDYTVFHGADYVLCYLINSHDSKHWWWLKKIAGVYSVYSDTELDSVTAECLPAVLPICYCKKIDNKFIIDKNRYCT